jgi:hypothetical protein
MLQPLTDLTVFPFTMCMGGITLPSAFTEASMVTFSRELLVLPGTFREPFRAHTLVGQVFGVPKTTIIDQVSGRIELTSKPVIPLEIENAVAQKVVEAANMGFGIHL